MLHPRSNDKEKDDTVISSIKDLNDILWNNSIFELSILLQFIEFFVLNSKCHSIYLIFASKRYYLNLKIILVSQYCIVFRILRFLLKSRCVIGRKWYLSHTAVFIRSPFLPHTRCKRKVVMRGGTTKCKQDYTFSWQEEGTFESSHWYH